MHSNVIAKKILRKKGRYGTIAEGPDVAAFSSLFAVLHPKTKHFIRNEFCIWKVNIFPIKFYFSLHMYTYIENLQEFQAFAKIYPKWILQICIGLE